MDIINFVGVINFPLHNYNSVLYNLLYPAQEVKSNKPTFNFMIVMGVIILVSISVIMLISTMVWLKKRAKGARRMENKIDPTNVEKTQKIDFQLVSSQQMSSQPMNSQPMDSQPMGSHSMIDPRDVPSKPLMKQMSSKLGTKPMSSCPMTPISSIPLTSIPSCPLTSTTTRKKYHAV